jgi:hypothetical protein
MLPVLYILSPFFKGVLYELIVLKSLAETALLIAVEIPAPH